MSTETPADEAALGLLGVYLGVIAVGGRELARRIESGELAFDPSVPGTLRSWADAAQYDLDGFAAHGADEAVWANVAGTIKDFGDVTRYSTPDIARQLVGTCSGPVGQGIQGYEALLEGTRTVMGPDALKLALDISCAAENREALRSAERVLAREALSSSDVQWVGRADGLVVGSWDDFFRACTGPDPDGRYHVLAWRTVIVGDGWWLEPSDSEAPDETWAFRRVPAARPDAKALTGAAALHLD